MTNNQDEGNWGGTREGAGRPAGSTNEAKGLPTAKRVQLRMYPEDLAIAERLVDLGFGSDRSDVVRKALREALEQAARPPATKPEIDREQLSDFCRRHHIRWLALFGSTLRDDFGPDSDVDLLVEFEPAAQIGLVAFARTKRELSALFGREVDLVTRAGLKPEIKPDVLAGAEVLYEV